MRWPLITSFIVYIILVLVRDDYLNLTVSFLIVIFGLLLGYYIKYRFFQKPENHK